MFKKTLPALLLDLTLTAGCESLGLGGDNQNNTDDTIPRSRDRISKDRNDPNRDRGGYDGSEMKYPADFDHGIPSDARLIREVDTNGSISYKAPHEGKLYVYDADSRRVTWSGTVRDGERFRLDSNNGRASIDDQSIMKDRDLNPDHHYHLYFVRGARDSVDNSSSNDRNVPLNDRSSDRNDDLR